MLDQLATSRCFCKLGFKSKCTVLEFRNLVNTESHLTLLDHGGREPTTIRIKDKT